jgi:pimeloyl-ACP methyl ester carboxylesterase
VLYIAADESEHYKRIRDTFTLENLQKDFRNVRLEIVQEAGHMLHLEQAERVAQLLQDFIAS